MAIDLFPAEDKNYPRDEASLENTPVTDWAIPVPKASTAIATNTSMTAYSTVVTPFSSRSGPVNTSRRFMVLISLCFCEYRQGGSSEPEKRIVSMKKSHKKIAR